MGKTFQSIAEWQSALDGFDRSLTKFAEDAASRVARKAEGIADRSAASDVGGDRKMSNFPPRLDLRVKRIDEGAVLMPRGRAAAGAWTLAERGRNMGETGRFQGPGLNLRTGASSFTKSGRARASRRTAKRWTGYTSGWSTASKAVARFPDGAVPMRAALEKAEAKEF